MAREQLAFDDYLATPQDFAHQLLCELLDARVHDEFDKLAAYADKQGHATDRLSVAGVSTVGQARTAARLTDAWIDDPGLAVTDDSSHPEIADDVRNWYAIVVICNAIKNSLRPANPPQEQQGNATTEAMRTLLTAIVESTKNNVFGREYPNIRRAINDLPGSARDELRARIRLYDLHYEADDRDGIFNDEYDDWTKQYDRTFHPLEDVTSSTGETHSFLAKKTLERFNLRRKTLAKTQAAQERQRSMIDAFFHEQYCRIDASWATTGWPVDLMGWIPWPLKFGSGEHELDCWVINVRGRVDDEARYLEKIDSARERRAPADQRMTGSKRAGVDDGGAVPTVSELIDAEVEFLESQGVPHDRIARVAKAAAEQTQGPTASKQLLDWVANRDDARGPVPNQIESALAQCTPVERVQSLRIVRDALDDSITGQRNIHDEDQRSTHGAIFDSSDRIETHP